MSVRDHRDKAEGKRFKPRMPRPDEAKLGTRVHDDYEEQYEEEVPEIDQCKHCNSYVETVELEEYDGACYWCSDVCNEVLEDSDE